MWKQLDDWIMKMGYIYTMEYYSAIRKDEILPFTTSWVDLESIMLNKSGLAGVAQWIEHWPVNQRVACSIPSQGTCLG